MSDYVDCVVVGQKSIGKHSLLSQLAKEDHAGDEIQLTMSVDNKTVEFVVKVADEFMESKRRRLMYLKADVIILGYSCVDVVTFNKAKKQWIQEVQSQAPNVPVLLMATKADRVPDRLHERTKTRCEEASTELGCVAFQLVSTKEQSDNTPTQLFERAVRAGMTKKRLQQQGFQPEAKRKRAMFCCFPRAPRTVSSFALDEGANLELSAKISKVVYERAYTWRGELLCSLVEDLLDGHIDYGHNDSTREMREMFDIEDTSRAVGEVCSKLMLFFHFMPIAQQALEMHNMQFWLEVEALKHNPELRRKAKYLKRDAVNIYRLYVNQNSEREIHIEDEVRNAITVALKAVSNARVFDLAQLNVLTLLTPLFRQRFVNSATSRKLLAFFREHEDLMPTVKPIEVDALPQATGDGLSRLMKQSVHIMTLMEFLQSPNSWDKRPTNVQFLAEEDHGRIAQLGVKHLVTYAALKRHVDKEKSMENLMFWLDAEDYRSLDFGVPVGDESAENFEHRVTKKLMTRAKHIADRYVRDDAEWLINLPAHQTSAIFAALKELETAALSTKAHPEVAAKSRTIFDDAQREILLLIKRDSWRRFQSSTEAQLVKTMVHNMFAVEEFADPEFNRLEARFQARFELMSDEALVRTFNCALERKMLLHGELQLSKRYLCFFSSVFGFKTKLVYNYSEILSISEEVVESQGKTEVVVVVSTNDNIRHTFRNVLPTPKQLMYTLRKAQQRLRTHVRGPQGDLGVGQRPNEDQAEETTAGMTDTDWELFKEGAELMEYHKDEVILAEGTPAGNVYQIARGSCRIEKRTDSGIVLLRNCEEGEIIGEISFIEGGTTSASVVANNNVLVYVMSRDFVESALVNNPGLPGRFYKFLATLLADRLKTKKELGVKKECAPDEDSQLKCEFRRHFGFQDRSPNDKSVEVLQSWDAAVRHNSLSMLGTLYLSESVLWFHSHVLGSVRREIIPLDDVTSLEVVQKSLVVNRSAADLRREFVDLDDAAAARAAIAQQVAVVKKAPTPLPVPVSNNNDDTDWTMFLGGTELKQYKAGETILRQSEVSPFVFHLARGAVSVIRDVDKGGPAAVLKGGELFGEITFLQGGASTASIVAQQDNTFVYSIEKEFVDSLLELNAELPGRFYRFLAAALATRLKN